MQRRARYDAEAIAVYLYLQDDIGVAGVAKMAPVDPLDLGGMVNLALDHQGRPVGLATLCASTLVPQDLLCALNVRGSE